MLNAEVSIFVGDTKAATTLRDAQGIRYLDFTVPSDISEIVLGQDSFFVHITLLNIADTYHYVAFFPLIGESGVPIGMFKIAIPA
jgi:hypothetical protein